MLFANVFVVLASACSFTSASSIASGDRVALHSRADAQAFVAITTAYAPVTDAIKVCHQKVTGLKDVQKIAATLTEFQQELEKVTRIWSKPCGCQAETHAAATFNAQLQTWLSELQEIIQYVSKNFPTTYQKYCGGIFSSIGTLFQTAITPAVDAGVDVAKVVGGIGLNEGLFASVNIQTSTFKKSSKTTSTSSSSSSTSSISNGVGGVTKPIP